MHRHEILSMEAGCELDALVAEKVMGYKEDKAGNLLPPGFVGSAWAAFALGGAPFYSTDITAAWDVVEAVRASGWLLSLGEGMSGYGDATVWMVDFYKGNRTCLSANGPDLPVTICRAALLVVMEADE